MEIPLILSSPRPDRLVYALPIWYRVVVTFILALVVSALLMDGSGFGFLAWTVLIILLLSALYEDKWTFDAVAGRATYRAGLLIAAKSTVIEFSAIERFCIIPLVKGTIPGTEEEKSENAAALAGKRVDDGHFKRSLHKKPFLNLAIECTNGARYLIDHAPARNMAKLRTVASQIANLCDKPVSEA